VTVGDAARHYAQWRRWSNFERAIDGAIENPAEDSGKAGVTFNGTTALDEPEYA